MKIKDLLFLSFSSLKNNPLRSFLSGLGVFMGVFAISGTLQVNDIGKSFLKKQLAEVESPQIYIYSYYNEVTYEFEPYQAEDLEWLKKRLSGWRYISGIGDMEQNTIYYKNEKINIEYQAVAADFLAISGRKLIAGYFFTNEDLANTRPVVVIDQFLAQKLFKGQNPVGKPIYFQNKSYYIKGIIQTQKSDQWSDNSQGLILIPLSVYQVLKSSPLIDKIIISPTHTKDLEIIKDQVRELLKQRFSDQFIWIESNIEGIKESEKTLNIVAIILLLIGGITLFVGGVGIANITIASVLERTSEIGLRRAIGGTKKDILIQFLLESTCISIAGGVIAIATVQGITIIVVNIFSLPYQFNFQTPLISLSSAIFVGVVSSFLPALKASQLDPVEALRSK